MKRQSLEQFDKLTVVSYEGVAGCGRIVARLARQVEIALVAVELSLPQFRILGILADGSTGASALAEKLTVSRPTVTAAVDGLVAKGFVARQAHPHDRRRIHHTLTPEGELALVEADRAVAERLSEIAGYLEEPTMAYDGLQLWRLALDTRREARIAARA
jgi:long-chain acyl-CoA synthetase